MQACGCNSGQQERVVVCSCLEEPSSTECIEGRIQKEVFVAQVLIVEERIQNYNCFLIFLLVPLTLEWKYRIKLTSVKLTDPSSCAH